MPSDASLLVWKVAKTLTLHEAATSLDFSPVLGDGRYDFPGSVETKWVII